MTGPTRQPWRLRAVARLLVVFGAEAALVVAVHRLVAASRLVPHAADAAPWLRTATPVDACAALAGVGALAAAWWLLVGSVADLVAAAAGVPSTTRRRLPLTLPLVRGAVDAVVLGTVVLTLAAAVPAFADPPPGGTPAATVRDGRAPPSGPATPPVRAVTTAPAAATDVVVVPGDNLWELSAAAMARATGRPRAAVTDGEVAPYWVEVCAENATRVRSGDVDLIYPGEVVVLPPVS